ncbi:MAG: glycosyltransferase family 39 protein [Flavobacteriales bacterium]|nr:glycosyltransferase family 39 protein [Flavobacteriales bacterium]
MAREGFLLLLIWGIATWVDLDKPFQVDDPFHVEMAQWVEQHPTKPLSGSIVWGNGLVPMHHGNQPPGFYYVLAASGSVFGYSERAMHLTRSLFSLLALVCFFRLARARGARSPISVTALLALGPAFLVNQGVMIDVPLLALHLLFFDLLLIPRNDSPSRRYVLAGMVLFAGLFFKYNTAPLLFLFPLALILNNEKRLLWTTLIPPVLLGLWCCWNLWEFGSPHLIGREALSLEQRPLWQRIVAWMTTAGAIAPFALSLFLATLPRIRKHSTWILCAALLVFVLFAIGVHQGIVEERTADTLLFAAFVGNGGLLIAATMRSSRRPRMDIFTWMLVGWCVSMMSFILVFAPFMATRHVLLVIPAMLLLAIPVFDRLNGSTRGLTIASTACLGLLLTLSDRLYADYYRHQATHYAVTLRDEGRLWSTGLWGWYWYTKQAGIFIYPDDPSAAEGLRTGDVLLTAHNVHGQEIAPGLRLEPLMDSYEFPSIGTFFCTGHHASMFTSDLGHLPWHLSRSRRNHISAHRVTVIRNDSAPGLGPTPTHVQADLDDRTTEGVVPRSIIHR